MIRTLTYYCPLSRWKSLGLKIPFQYIANSETFDETTTYFLNKYIKEDWEYLFEEDIDYYNHFPFFNKITYVELFDSEIFYSKENDRPWVFLKITITLNHNVDCLSYIEENLLKEWIEKKLDELNTYLSSHKNKNKEFFQIGDRDSIELYQKFDIDLIINK